MSTNKRMQPLRRSKRLIAVNADSAKSSQINNMNGNKITMTFKELEENVGSQHVAKTTALTTSTITNPRSKTFIESTASSSTSSKDERLMTKQSFAKKSRARIMTTPTRETATTMTTNKTIQNKWTRKVVSNITPKTKNSREEGIRSTPKITMTAEEVLKNLGKDSNGGSARHLLQSRIRSGMSYRNSASRPKLPSPPNEMEATIEDIETEIDYDESSEDYYYDDAKSPSISCSEMSDFNEFIDQSSSKSEEVELNESILDQPSCSFSLESYGKEEKRHDVMYSHHSPKNSKTDLCGEDDDEAIINSIEQIYLASPIPKGNAPLIEAVKTNTAKDIRETEYSKNVTRKSREIAATLSMRKKMNRQRSRVHVPSTEKETSLIGETVEFSMPSSQFDIETYENTSSSKNRTVANEKQKNKSCVMPAHTPPPLGDHKEDIQPNSNTRQPGCKTPSKGAVITPEMARRTPLKQLPLSVQREKERRHEENRQMRRQNETKSPGASGTRRNLDKRTARLRYSGDFRADIMNHRKKNPHVNDGRNHCDDDANIHQRERNGVTIFVRKRPIFQYELDRSDYDIVSVDSTSSDTLDTVMIHNCVMHPDMRQMFVKPVSFPCTGAFDEHCSDDSIYQHVAEPLVNIAVRGGVATILMYGQTGSGKTFTMSGIEERAAEGLFHALAYSNGREMHPTNKPSVTMQFVELTGKICKDLLGRGSEVKLADSDDGTVQLLGATSAPVTSASHLAKLIFKGKSRRATEATDKNGVSSRSHAVCQLRIKFHRKRNDRQGLLTLIDCAGSERRHDSMYHSSKRQKESAEINASLWALKECVRARALNDLHAEEGGKTSVHVPYRSSNLTRILRESFERDGAKLCVIATVAPNATDTEHTMETLRTVSGIVGFENLINEGEAHSVTPISSKEENMITPPKQWDHEQLVLWLSKRKFRRIKVTQILNGKTIMRMSLQQMRAQLFDQRDREEASRLFNALRKETDRVSKIQHRRRVELSNNRKEKLNF